MSYTDKLVKKYQDKMYRTSGVLVSDTEAQADLESLASVFITFSIAEHRTKSRE